MKKEKERWYVRIIEEDGSESYPVICESTTEMFKTYRLHQKIIEERGGGTLKINKLVPKSE